MNTRMVSWRVNPFGDWISHLWKDEEIIESQSLPTRAAVEALLLARLRGYAAPATSPGAAPTNQTAGRRA